MGAPLGFKTFATGDVLTAADTNGYLMQGVWTFANAAARDAAVTSPQEGNFCYLKDTNVTQYYSGSAWTSVGGGGGKVLQVVQGTTATGVTVTSTSYTDSGITATITPSATSSKIIALVNMAVLISTQDTNGQGMIVKLMRGATDILENTRGLFLTSAVGGGGASSMQTWYPISYMDSPSTTSATTYKVQIKCSTAASATTVIAQVANQPSAIILMEIGA
jgi:hypothetical protein